MTGQRDNDHRAFVEREQYGEPRNRRDALHEHKTLGIVHRHPHYHSHADAGRPCSDIRHSHHATTEDAVAGRATIGPLVRPSAPTAALPPLPILPMTSSERARMTMASLPRDEKGRVQKRQDTTRAPADAVSSTPAPGEDPQSAAVRRLADALFALAVAIDRQG